MLVTTTNFRAELNDNYCYIRNLGENGGVVDALLNTKSKQEKVKAILAESGEKTFSQIWLEVNKIKGVNFEYSAN